MAIKTVFITTTGTSTFTVPADFVRLVSVECIGGGGTGGIQSSNLSNGGGGGAYARSTSVQGLGPGSTAFVNVGTGGVQTNFVIANGVAGGDSWFNAVANAAPTLASQGALARGGGAGTSGGTPGAGGSAATSIGDVTFSGGSGAASGGISPLKGAGGGAAGPGGAGGAGGTGAGAGGGGGGSGATLTAPGTAGANGTAGAGGIGGASAGQTAGTGATTSAAAGVALAGGGGGGGFNTTNTLGSAGGAGNFWTQTSNGATAGSGGGVGGSGANGAGAPSGGLYGGGGTGQNLGSGGSGAQGIVVFTYDDTPPPAVTSFVNQISGSGSKTISCFLRTNSVNRMGIAGTRQVASNTGWVFCVNRTTAGNLTYFHTGGSVLEVAAGIVTGTWYYAVATYDLTTATASLYLNGALIGAPGTGFSAITTSTFNGVVAAEDNSFTNPFVGNIANFSVYNRALSADEILQNFNALRGRYSI